MSAITPHVTLMQARGPPQAMHRMQPMVHHQRIVAPSGVTTVGPLGHVRGAAVVITANGAASVVNPANMASPPNVTAPLSPQFYGLQPSPPSGLLQLSPIAVDTSSPPPPPPHLVTVGHNGVTSPAATNRLMLQQQPHRPQQTTTSNVIEIKTEPQPYSPATSTGSGGMQQGQPGGASSPFEQAKSPFSSQGPSNQQGPTNTTNGGGDANRGQQRRRPQEELCLVCGDRASGYHYNALACEGCKGFFRRSITKNSKHSCKYGDQCEIDMYMRRKCQACRLKKCYTVGMRAECVVPESQCQKKREAKKASQKRNNSGDSTEGGTVAVLGSTAMSPTGTALQPQVKRELSGDGTSATTASILGALGFTSSSQSRLSDNASAPRNLKPEEEELINRIVFYQDEYENPTEEDLNRVYHVPIQPVSGETAETESDRLFQHMTEMTILTVQLIVEFSKHLPGFQTLCREDQVSLLKGCSSEVMMLRGARRYDPQRDSIIYATNYPFSKDNYVKAGLANEALFRFCRNMCKMKVDNAEYALITAIVIFSDRHNVREPKRVEKIQEIYVEALQSYVMAKRKKEHMVCFAKLLSVLTELRSLGNSNAKTCFELRMINRKLPPFLAEIWDIK